MMSKDLTKLIEGLKSNDCPDSDPTWECECPHMLPEQRDEIVLALRVLRVMAHPRSIKMYYGVGEPIFFVTNEAGQEVGGILLTDAERILGLEKGGER